MGRYVLRSVIHKGLHRHTYRRLCHRLNRCAVCLCAMRWRLNVSVSVSALREEMKVSALVVAVVMIDSMTLVVVCENVRTTVCSCHTISEDESCLHRVSSVYAECGLVVLVVERQNLSPSPNKYEKRPLLAVASVCACVRSSIHPIASYHSLGHATCACSCGLVCDPV